jgi:CRP-like cAMP-binding protein
MPNLDRSVVQALPVFSAMGEAELDNAIAHARAQRIPKGAAVFRQGERAESFFVLLHGRLKVVKVTPHGQQMIIRFVNPGDIYGIAKALRREDYRATASAVVDCVTLAWPAQAWDDFMAAHPVFAVNVNANDGWAPARGPRQDQGAVDRGGRASRRPYLVAARHAVCAAYG